MLENLLDLLKLLSIVVSIIKLLIVVLKNYCYKKGSKIATTNWYWGYINFLDSEDRHLVKNKIFWTYCEF